MIAAINGIIVDKNTSSIIIQTNYGVSYEILVSNSTADSLELNQVITLFTSFIVREQEMFLVGFLTLQDKKLFETLITAKGIGPKQGIKILSEIPSDELRIAIVSGDINKLTKIKGISQKKAEQLILDLQEKMKKDIAKSPIANIALDVSSQQKTEVLLTMRALGYSDGEIKKPLDAFFEESDTKNKNTEVLVSEFLILLSSR